MKMEKDYVSYPVYRFEELNGEQFKRCKNAMVEYECEHEDDDEREIKIRSFGGKYPLDGMYRFTLTCSDFRLMQKRIATAEEAIENFNEIDRKMQIILDNLVKIIEENES